MSHITYTFDETGPQPAVIAGHHENGNLDLFSTEGGDSDDVKLFRNVPQGEGGNTYQKAE